uniref:ZP domain-containing protein n=1 Tax=Steinernema glaseri TaxID=37863 RepID=A0A1I7Y0V3_9BILA
MNGHGMNSRFQINGNGGHLNGQHSGQNGHHNAPSHVGQSRTLEDALFDDETYENAAPMHVRSQANSRKSEFSILYGEPSYTTSHTMDVYITTYDVVCDVVCDSSYDGIFPPKSQTTSYTTS